MTRIERKVLKALDHKIDTKPEALGADNIRRYRELLIKHVAEACTASRRGGALAPTPV